MSDWHRDGLLHFGVGIEDTFVPHETPGRRALDEYALTDHYTSWREDLRLAADSGAELIRWGVPWYRVEAEPGRFDWKWVDDVIDEMTSLRLECVLDLIHYGTPRWLSFLDPAYPDRVALYARTAAARYRDRISWFTTVNEPVLHAYNGGQIGYWPPELSGHDGFVRLLLALCRGMARTQEEIVAVHPEARFAHVDAGLLWAGTTSPEPRTLLEERRFAALELTMGRVDGSHRLHDYLLAHGAHTGDLDWFRAHAVTPDVYGVNYYPAISTVARVDGVETPLEAGTDGLRSLLAAYRERYDGPFALTETSRVGSGDERAQWLVDSVATVEDLRANGMAIAGYIWFPFLGLFDWEYRNVTGPRDPWWLPMGLVDLDPGPDDTLARRPNAAHSRFQQLARFARDGKEEHALLADDSAVGIV
jgi:beta-glucosidase